MNGQPELGLMELLLMQIRQPEYRHVLLHGFPIYGMFFSIIALGVALLARSRKADLVALTLVIVSGLSAWPVYQAGDEAYDRVSTLADMDKVGIAWLDEHMERADKVVNLFYGVALLGVIALLVPIKWPKARVPLLLLTLMGSIAASGAGGYIAYAGGKVRHKEFRLTPPPEPKPADS